MKLSAALFMLFAISIISAYCGHLSSGSKTNLVKRGRNRLDLLHRKLKSFLKTSQSPLPCWICKRIVAELQIWFLTDSSKRTVEKLVVYVCEKFHIEDSTVCKGVASEFRDEVLYVIAKVIFNPPAICTLFGSPCNYTFGPDSWQIRFPNTTKPPVEPPTIIPPGIPTLKVLQLTDLHYDPHYQEGADVDCPEPLCCRYSTGKAGRKAGKWGSPGTCDTPLKTLENLFDHLAHQQFDLILLTGDLPPHNIWNQSREDQLQIIQTVVALLQRYFPATPVYPALGNHESAPVNSFPPDFPDLPERFNISWLYGTLVKDWPNLIKHNRTDDKIADTASYEVEICRGLKVLSINTNYGNPENWWLAINDSDPNGILSWLVERLQMAEDQHYKVIIIGHSPNQQNRKIWSENYYNITNRYESAITAQIFGHTHFDTFTVFYEDNNSSGRATNVAYVGPSVTPYAKVNPAYRVYYLDAVREGATYTIVDHETYYLDLSKCANSSSPQWTLEYSAKTAYGMTGLWPNDWNELADRISNDSQLLEEYSRYRLVSKTKVACDERCREKLLCDMRNGQSSTPC